MSAWGGCHPEPPEHGAEDRCSRIIDGRSVVHVRIRPEALRFVSCDKPVTWVSLGGWRVGQWWHLDGSPPHQLFEELRRNGHPSTVTKRPEALTDWNAEALDVAAALGSKN